MHPLENDNLTCEVSDCVCGCSGGRVAGPAAAAAARQRQDLFRRGRVSSGAEGVKG